MLRATALLLFLVSTATLSASATVPTSVTVRAVSRDAKVLGDGVGGARITIRDLDTGRILATGIQTGGTGETKRIMQEPRARGAVIYGTDGAAAFRATLDLAGPTRVEISAEGPLKYPQAVQRTSTTMLLLPGRNVDGEGVLLEIAGFIVDVTPLSPVRAGEPLTVRTKVTMTCGCPTEPGGLWDANRISVSARLLRNGVAVRETALAYAGVSSTYEAAVTGLEEGSYEVEVVAVDERAGNAGRGIAHAVVGSPARNGR